MLSHKLILRATSRERINLRDFCCVNLTKIPFFAEMELYRVGSAVIPNIEKIMQHVNRQTTNKNGGNK